ncbi:MAG: hypothetical protein LBR26_00090, partial [Prevotella sp.]|nr:hypothetical protein [Prevotella sp.]
MNKTISATGSVLRKAFARFFGQGVSSLFRNCNADDTGQSVAGAFLRFFPAMPVTLFSLFSLLPVLSPAQGFPVSVTKVGIKGAGIKTTGLGRIDPYSPKVFYFPFGSSDLLRDYADNRRMFEALDSLLRTEEIVSAIDTVQILAGCSPAGSEGYNQELALKRAQSMYAYLLLHHGNIAENCPVDVRPVGIDWQGYGVLLRSKLGLGYKQMWDLLQYASVRLKMKDGSYIPKGGSSPIQRLAEDTLTSLPS